MSGEGKTKSLQVVLQEGETEAQAMARAVSNPVSNATVTVFQFNQLSGVTGSVDITALQSELAARVMKVHQGEMERPEAILVAQAHTLDALFNSLGQRAAMNFGAGHKDAGETYLRLALKAQSQCRTTLEALAEIKNPTAPTFVKQQNIAHNQQVNNGVTGNPPVSAPSRTHEKDVTPTNELLEASNGERLDFETARAAGGVHPNLEAVGALHRSKD